LRCIRGNCNGCFRYDEDQASWLNPFRKVDRLFRYRIDIASDVSSLASGNITSDLVRVDLREVAQSVARFEVPDLQREV
jgi:hypothetical protein